MIDPRLTTLRRSAGKPLLCIPFFVDQPDVAARVRDLGAGLTLDKQSISADNVRYSVLELLSQDAYRAAAETASVALRSGGGLSKAAEVRHVTPTLPRPAPPACIPALSRLSL